MSEQPKVTRRHALLGGVAVAALALASTISPEAPVARAGASPSRKKYYYSINPASNEHRYGWLEMPGTMKKSVPVAVLIHGGAWESEGGTASMRFISEYLAQHGVACWNIEYRALGSGGGWPTTYADVCDAIDHLIALKLSVAPNLDLDRVFTIGHSAGAQLGALALGQSPRKVDVMGLLMNTPLIRMSKEMLQLSQLRGDLSAESSTNEKDGLEGFFSDIFQRDESPSKGKSGTGVGTQAGALGPHYGIIGTGNEAGQPAVAPEGPRIPIRGFASLNGVLDVVDSANRSKYSNIREFLGGTPKEVPGNYSAANPIRHLPSSKHLLLVQGTRDYVIPQGQAKRYAAASVRRNNKVYLLTIKGAKHNDVLVPWRNPTAYRTVTKALLQFLGMAPKQPATIR